MKNNYHKKVTREDKFARKYYCQRARLNSIRTDEGLSMIPKLSFGDEVILYTDSAYLCNCYLNKWYSSWERNGWRNSKKEPVANKDLWEKLIPYFKNPQITISKVKGHSGNYYNELVDELAVNEREKLM